MATFNINPNDYGFRNIESLATAIATMQGEAGGHGIQGKAMVLDNAANRGSSQQFAGYNNKIAGLDPIANQFKAYKQYSTWSPTQGSYKATQDYYNHVLNMAKDPNYFNNLPKGTQKELMEGLSAAYGVLGGDASLRGITGGATFYSTGVIPKKSTMAEHVGYGLDTAKQFGKVGGHYWYGDGAEGTTKAQNALRSFDYEGALNKLQNQGLPGYRMNVPEGGPPRRPGEFAPEETIGGALGGALNGFSDAITGGLNNLGNSAQSAWNAAGNTLSGLFGGMYGGGDLIGPSGGQPGKAGEAPKPAWFDEQAYYAANPDVATAGVNAWSHFLNNGITEQRALSPFGGHFDPSRYMEQYGDVAQSGMDAAKHFSQFGAKEGRDLPLSDAPTYFNGLVANATGEAVPSLTYNNGTEASPYFHGFDAKLYKEANPDVAAAGVDPLQHFLSQGFREGRTIDPFGDQIAQTFDRDAYLKSNPDVQASGMDPLEHFVRFGGVEGRTWGPDGDTPTIGHGVAANLINDPTLAQTYAPGGDLARLYGAPGATPTQGPGITTGTAGPPALTTTQGPGGATPTQGPPSAVQAWEQNYYDANPDVRASGMGAMEHYLRFGRPEGRAIDTLGEKFDDQAYLAKNQDVARAGLDPLLHYLRNGIPEGRQAELVGPDGATRGVDNWLDAGTLNNATYAPLIQNYQNAHTYAAPPLTLTQGPGALTQTQGPPGLTPTIGAPGETPTIGPPEAVHAWNADEYLRDNPDVARAGIDPAYHASRFGAAEGRTAGFDPASIPKFMQGWGGSAGADYQDWIRKLTMPGYMQAPFDPSQHDPIDGGNRPLGSGISYNNGSIQYGGVDIGAGGLFDPKQAENAYLNTQVDQINAGARHSADVAGMLTGYDPRAGYTPMPTFGVNGTQQGNMGVVAQNQLGYLNNVNTALGQLTPIAPAASSFLPTAPMSFTGFR